MVMVHDNEYTMIDVIYVMQLEVTVSSTFTLRLQRYETSRFSRCCITLNVEKLWHLAITILRFDNL